MTKIRIVLEIEVKEMGEDETDYFIETVIKNTEPEGRLILHSNELGDEIGVAEVISAEIVER